MEWDAYGPHLSTAPVQYMILIAFLPLGQEMEASPATWSGRAGAGASFRFATRVIHYITIGNSYYYPNTEKII